MTKKQSYDFAVIGCGIAGASIAYELSQTGAKVLVLEAEAHAAFHTTGRSAAFFMEGYGNSVVRQFTQASRDFYEKPPIDFNQTDLLKDLGALYISTPEQEIRLNNIYQNLVQFIPDCQLVDQTFISNKISAINSNVQKAYWEPNAKEINVSELLHGYIKLAKRNNCEFMFSKQLKHMYFDGSHWMLNQKYQCHTVVNAAGAWADSVAKLASAKLKNLTPMIRNVCVIKLEKTPEDIQTWPLCVDIDEQFYFKPEGQYLLLTPADEIPSDAHDAQADEYQIALGIERVKQVLDVNFSSIQKKWAGLRTFAQDKSPVVGFDPDIKNFFWLAGQGGYGIQMAPALAKTASELCIKQQELSSISPARFE